MKGNENWDLLYAYMYLRFWPSNVPMISYLNIDIWFKSNEMQIFTPPVHRGSRIVAVGLILYNQIQHMLIFFNFYIPLLFQI